MTARRYDPDLDDVEAACVTLVAWLDRDGDATFAERRRAVAILVRHGRETLARERSGEAEAWRRTLAGQFEELALALRGVSAALRRAIERRP